MVKVLNARLARAGTAEERRRKIALNWAMIKIVPEQGRAAQGKPATANISPALVILVINILAPAPATQAAPVPPAAENIPLVIVNHHILGTMVLALAILAINTPALAQATPAAPVLPAVASIQPALAPAVMNGKTVAAKNKF